MIYIFSWPEAELFFKQLNPLSSPLSPLPRVCSAATSAKATRGSDPNYRSGRNFACKYFNQTFAETKVAGYVQLKCSLKLREAIARLPVRHSREREINFQVIINRFDIPSNSMDY